MIAGMVVGSAGTLLTVLMAKAMNRSLANVLFSNFGDATVAGGDTTHGEMKSADASDAAIAMRYASSVVIIPGYGLAVAQAQQKLYEFVKLLQAAGVDVKFAIHPVAGRMPGHMNVLLAEAGVPYDIIYDMEDINADFEYRRRAGDRGERRRQSGGAHRQDLADLRHADPQRRPGPSGLCDQARSGQRLFRRREPSVLRGKLQHGLRRCAGRDDPDGPSRERSRRLISIPKPCHHSPRRTNMAYATINPYTGETVATFPDATDAEAKAALDKADAAFHTWRETSFAERGRILQNAADLLRRDSDAYAKLLTLEMGKLFAEAKAEVELSAKIFEYYVRHAEALLKPEKLPFSTRPRAKRFVHEPLGVLVAIEPWNFPYYQIARILAPQLSAGNTLILKHASNVPQSAAAFEKLMSEAGLPEGCFKNSMRRATRST
jgi:hypothetical protein